MVESMYLSSRTGFARSCAREGPSRREGKKRLWKADRGNSGIEKCKSNFLDRVPRIGRISSPCPSFRHCVLGVQ